MSRKERIEQKLNENLSPTFLAVDDESNRHHVPLNAETHFKVIAVSARFLNETRLARHRLVNDLVHEEFNQGLHALSLHLYTHEEWLKAKDRLLSSPRCKDGFEH